MNYENDLVNLPFANEKLRNTINFPDMDLKQIHELIKIINKSNFGEISIEDKDGKVTI